MLEHFTKVIRILKGLFLKRIYQYFYSLHCHFLLFISAIYFELTDKVGHMFGPDSFQLKSVLSNLGDTLETMLIQMKIMHLTDSVNVLLVSDHGMTNISPKRVIDLNHALNMKDIQHMYGGTFFSVWPHENKVKKVSVTK